MKINIINTFDNYGGAARAAFRLYRGLRDAVGDDCAMLSLYKYSQDPGVRTLAPAAAEDVARAHAIEAEIAAETAPYPVLQAGGFPPFHSERSPFGDILVQQMPAADVVNLHWVRGFVDYGAFFRSRPPGQPVVWTLHDMNAFTGGCHYTAGCDRYIDACGACPVLESTDPEDASFQVLQRKRAILAARTGGPLHVVAPSRWLAAEAKRSRLFADLPVSVIPYGLETDVFVPHDRQAARQSFNLPADLKIILFIAHVVTDPRKGLARLDEALARLGPQNDVALLLVGQGTPTLTAPVQCLRSGLVNDDATVSRLYSAADLVVVPSLEDNLPNTVLEAMASGTATAGFAIGGIPDMIIPGETGFLADPADPQSLDRALAEALADPARLAALGRGARARVEREHTLARQAERYLDLYRSLLPAA